jgi:tRNA(Arg) A34 adenosine deaminase TadA
MKLLAFLPLALVLAVVTLPFVQAEMPAAPSASPAPLPDDPKALAEDHKFMARAFALADDAVKKGNAPFGALMVKDHQILFEYENTAHATHDVTKHAETGLISAASPKFDRATFNASTLYTSTEPCTMCSGAIRFAGFHRVVYGVKETQMMQIIIGSVGVNPLTCKEIMARTAPEIEVVGPLDEAVGLKTHLAYWATHPRH